MLRLSVPLAILLLLAACGDPATVEGSDPARATASRSAEDVMPQAESTSTPDSAAAPGEGTGEPATGETDASRYANLPVVSSVLLRPLAEGSSTEGLLQDAQAILSSRLTSLDVSGASVTQRQPDLLSVEFTQEVPNELKGQLVVGSRPTFRPVIVSMPMIEPQEAGGDASADELAPAEPEAFSYDGWEGSVVVDPETWNEYVELRCSDSDSFDVQVEDADRNEPVVACAQSGTEKFILAPQAPIFVDSVELSPDTHDPKRQGVTIRTDLEGREVLAGVSSHLVSQDYTQTRLAFVADGVVISAPTIGTVIVDGVMEVDGLEEAQAEDLARWMRYTGDGLRFEVLESN